MSVVLLDLLDAEVRLNDIEATLGTDPVANFTDLTGRKIQLNLRLSHGQLDVFFIFSGSHWCEEIQEVNR